MLRAIRLLIACSLLVASCSDDTSPLNDASASDAHGTDPLDAGPMDAGPMDAEPPREDARPLDGGGECPPNVVEGAPCAIGGMMCGAQFESPGLRCVAPENVWVRCGTVRGLPGDRSWWCPPDQPTAGSVCCVVNPAFRPDECPYANNVQFRCTNDHWQQL